MKNKINWLLILAILTFLPQFASAQDKGEWGNLKGHIKVKGKLPDIPFEDVNKDKAMCLAGNAKAPLDDNLIVNENGEIRDVFVFMYFKNDDSPRPEVHPSYNEAKNKKVVLDNSKCRFVPHALLLRTGQTLELKNSDSGGHNCRILGFKDGNEHNINLPANESANVIAKNPEKSVTMVKCDIHPWMDAYILIRDEPYAAITGADGKFEIANVPAGTWKFQFWHKKGAYLRKLDIPGYKVGRRGEIEVTIKKGESLDLGQLTIPADSLNK